MNGQYGYANPLAEDKLPTHRGTDYFEVMYSIFLENMYEKQEDAQVLSSFPSTTLICWVVSFGVLTRYDVHVHHVAGCIPELLLYIRAGQLGCPHVSLFFLSLPSNGWYLICYTLLTLHLQEQFTF